MGYLTDMGVRWGRLTADVTSGCQISVAELQKDHHRADVMGKVLGTALGGGCSPNRLCAGCGYISGFGTDGRELGALSAASVPGELGSTAYIS